MSTAKDFVEILEIAMGKSVGKIVGQSILSNQLKKMNKDKNTLSADDCKVLTQNIASAVSLFVTKGEVGIIQSELDRLHKTCFS
jgi:hypothetical protein